MYKLFILAITVGGFVSAGFWNNVDNSKEDSRALKSQYCLAEDTSDDKLERSRRGKRNKGRRKGGNGLR